MPEAAEASREPDLILDRYRAVRPLGSGGSGSVWLARDERDDRDVALKVVPREGKAGLRAEREAEAVMRLRHPNCARVYSVDRDERHVYVAYEYLPGVTFRDALRGGRLDDRGAVEAGAQLLDALAHAHSRGIVHRDVKPANVLLLSGDGVAVRLLDFGLALMDDADTLTATGDVPGTLSYIAPERLDGDEATGAADVWAVGLMLWEALAGRAPFEAGSPVEIARSIAAGPPPLAEARPDLPRRLTAAVDSAVALDPGARPAPKRLAAELRRCLDAASRRRETRPRLARRTLLERGLHAGLAAGFVLVATSLLSFYPPGLAIALAAITALAALAAPRLALGLALAVPVLPLGDVALGLAVVYVPVALAWLCLHWRDPRSSLLFLAGPLLALGGLLALVPLVTSRAESAARRAVQTVAAVLTAALVAGLQGSPLPFDASAPPLGLGLDGSNDPGAVASTLWHALLDHPLVAVEAGALAAVAVAVPAVRAHGPWAVAGLGACLLGVGLLVPTAFGAGTPAALPFVLAVWLLCLTLVAEASRAKATS